MASYTPTDTTQPSMNPLFPQTGYLFSHSPFVTIGARLLLKQNPKLSQPSQRIEHPQRKLANLSDKASLEPGRSDIRILQKTKRGDRGKNDQEIPITNPKLIKPGNEGMQAEGKTVKASTKQNNRYAPHQAARPKVSSGAQGQVRKSKQESLHGTRLDTGDVGTSFPMDWETRNHDNLNGTAATRIPETYPHPQTTNTLDPDSITSPRVRDLLIQKHSITSQITTLGAKINFLESLKDELLVPQLQDLDKAEDSIENLEQTDLDELVEEVMTYSTESTIRDALNLRKKIRAFIPGKKNEIIEFRLLGEKRKADVVEQLKEARAQLVMHQGELSRVETELRVLDVNHGASEL